MAENLESSNDTSDVVNDENLDSEIISSIILEVVDACFTKYLPKEPPGTEVTEELRHLVEPIIDEIIQKVVASDVAIKKQEPDEAERKLSQTWMRNLLLQILSEKAFDTKPVISKEEVEAREKFRKEILQWLKKSTDEAIQAKLDANYLKRGGWKRLVPPEGKLPHDRDYFSYIMTIDKHAPVEVKFLLEDGSLIRKDYMLLTTILDIKIDFQDELCVPYRYITISEGDDEILDEVTLIDLKMKSPSECFQLALKYKVPEDIKTIIVTVNLDDTGEQKTIYVQIFNSCIAKPYLGGYKNKITGVEYQHAFSQTKGKIAHPDFGERLQRCTQTHYWREAAQNTTIDTATQMHKPDHYIATTTDRILPVGKYEDYESYCKRMDFVGKAIIIQKWWRGYTARKRFAVMVEKKRRDIEWEAAQIRAQKEAYEQYLKSEIVKKTYPFTKADFEKLYALMNAWYSVQSHKISDLKTEAPKKAELFSLLNKEMESLLALEKSKLEARKVKIVKDRKKFLDLCSAPIKFISKCGKKVLIETLEIQTAEKLRDIFLVMDQTNVPSDQYISNAAQIKSELTDYNKTETKELIQLLNKECMLLSRGLKIQDLSLFHERIERVYFELLKDPNFNPEAAKYVLAHALQKRKIKTNMCNSCKRVVTNNKFTVTSTSNKIQKCKCCNFKKRISTTKTGMGPYEHIKELLCIDEAKQRSNTYFAFIMQTKDYCLLISVIWHNESIISKCNDFNQLRLCRWNKYQDWSPWNCILLTLDEMMAHLKLNDLREVYDEEIIGKVLEKHLIAKCHFRNLLDLEKNAKMLGAEKKIKIGVQDKDIVIY